MIEKQKHQYAIREAISRVCGKSESYLEVGVNEGTSLEVAIKECPTIKSITLVDMWGLDYGGTGRGNHNHIEQFLKEWGYAGETRFLDGNSHNILPRLIQDGMEYDLVTIDGDHSEEGGKKDLWDGWALVKSGGWIVFDDITHVGHPYLMKVAKDFEVANKPSEAAWVTGEFINGAVAFKKP